jgi:hypothetical protein
MMETFAELQARVARKKEREREKERKGRKLFLETLRTLRKDKQQAVLRRRNEIKVIAGEQHTAKLELRELSRQISLHENADAEEVQ